MCYTYDSLGRVTSRTVKSLCDDSVVSSETFTYDAAGNVTGATDSVFHYDTNNRLTEYNWRKQTYLEGGNPVKPILKKIMSGVVALIATLNLWGCKFNQLDEEKIGHDMEGILTQLFNAVQARDQETFKTFFADHVVSLSDFEDGCNYVFNLYQGELLNINCNFPMATGKRIVPGEQICFAIATFGINTSENEYVAYVEFYTQYRSKYPETPYKIRKFKLLSKQQLENSENFNDCTQRYGIYYPGWISEEIT